MPDSTSQRTNVSFCCGHCRYSFKRDPERIIEAPEQDWHPWRYFAICPQCNTEAEQAHWERALLKGWAKATGPKTEEGKRKSAANLEGHPNLEAQRRTRFNRIKHGLSARVATYYPAKPGKYPHCKSCRWLDNGCGEWDHGACQTRMEIFLRHQIAFQTRDPSMLVQMNADQQSKIQALIDDILLAIINTGVEVRAPQWYQSDGVMHVAEYVDQEGNLRAIEDISAHPLLKPLYELMSRNVDILAKQGMTQKSQEDDALLSGFLAQKERHDEDLSGFAERQAQALEHLSGLIERSRDRQRHDPVLIEHQREGQE
ncbi:MAG: hypothetical protein ABTR07_15245 [Candidatus Competibacter denitrificans]